MKTVQMLSLACCMVFLLINCGKDDDGPKLTEVEKRTAILTAGTGIWTPSTSTPITVSTPGGGAIDVSELFKDFTLKFAAGTYTSSGTTPVWARSGTWVFTDDTATKIRRDDGLEIDITDIKDNSLTLSLEWDKPTFARSNSLAGTHVFVLDK